MVCNYFTVLVAATAVLARTPTGFSPASDTDLIVEYDGFAPLNGVDISKSVTTTTPRIGTLARLPGTSYAVLMIDLDIPTANPPETSTVLHWLQTDLTPSTSPTQLNTTSGPIAAFLLSTNTPAIAIYRGPNPPARIPLSHRYTQILVDTSEGFGEEEVEVLKEAAGTPRGFDAEAVLARAGLEGKVVAGNFYTVTNPGPAESADAIGAGNGTAGGGRGNGTGGRPVEGGGAGAGGRPVMALVGGLVAVGVLVLGL